MLYPLKFEPILVDRIWGGERLAGYGKPIRPDQTIGESWEISDRDDAQSRVALGVHKGKTLRELIQTYGDQLLGSHGATTSPPRFPLLIKLLDARETLSLQVHPPASVAGRLHGDPKTEMWHILEADQGAQLYAGLRRGVTGADFIRALEGNPHQLADYVHRFPVLPGDTIFIPSGRLHAIGAGLVLVEIQQNSDTTYRVYDWDRVGADGKPRALHVRESLLSIDFTDIAPGKQKPLVNPGGINGCWRLVECDHFHVHKLILTNAWSDRCDGRSFQVLTCVTGRVGILTAAGQVEELGRGESALLPAALGYYTLTPLAENAAVLKTFVPSK